MLRADVLGRSLINVNTARLVRANEVELTCEQGRWRVARRSTPASTRACGGSCRAAFAATRETTISSSPWSETEPFVGHVPTSRLRLRPRRLARLHAAQIADLVEAASHEEGEEIMQAVGLDKELEADVFEELDEQHQLEFLRERSDAQVAALLARMESDDAADLLMELDQDRRLPVLELLPADKRLKVKRLLGYNPQTAGGLMNPDFVSIPERSTVEQAIESVRRSEIPTEQTHTAVVVDATGHLVGTVSVVALVKAAGA